MIKMKSFSLLLMFFLISYGRSELNFTRIGEYRISSKMNTTEVYFEVKECISNCVQNSTCTAIGLEGNESRCEVTRLAYFGRIILEKKNNMSAVWIRRMFLQWATFCLLQYSGVARIFSGGGEGAPATKRRSRP